MLPFLPNLLLNNAARKNNDEQTKDQVFIVLFSQVHAWLRFQPVHYRQSSEIRFAACLRASRTEYAVFLEAQRQPVPQLLEKSSTLR
mmetsp:Transcript_8546/g.53409  ORF Transcript_8546/g.53409 Transcript_8546/m.53409 type:complete len:87 (-) Transcript_8546:611-871(-)